MRRRLICLVLALTPLVPGCGRIGFDLRELATVAEADGSNVAGPNPSTIPSPTNPTASAPTTMLPSDGLDAGSPTRPNGPSTPGSGGMDSGTSNPALPLEEASIANSEGDAATDAGISSAGPLQDAATSGDSGSAIPTGEFSAPVQISELTLAGFDEDDPALTQDRLEMYFTRGTAGGAGDWTIWRTTRGSVSEPWDTPSIVPELSSERETNAALSFDGLTIYFSSFRNSSSPGRDIFRSERLSRNDPWQTPEMVPAFNTPSDDVGAAPDADHLSLIGMSTSGGVRAFYLSDRPDLSAAWPTPQQLPGFDHRVLGSPRLTRRGLSLYFVAAPAAGGPRGLWQTVRTSKTDTFGESVELPGTTVVRPSNLWISEDERFVVYSGTGNDGITHLYESQR